MPSYRTTVKSINATNSLKFYWRQFWLNYEDFEDLDGRYKDHNRSWESVHNILSMGTCIICYLNIESLSLLYLWIMVHWDMLLCRELVLIMLLLFFAERLPLWTHWDTHESVVLCREVAWTQLWFSMVTKRSHLTWLLSEIYHAWFTQLNSWPPSCDLICQNTTNPWLAT